MTSLDELLSDSAHGMRRVLIIGSGGAGKSWLSRQLAARAGLPVVHLDQLYWNPGWVPRPREEWLAALDAVLATDAWIIDGNYTGTLERRLARCDTVIVVEAPRWLCMTRVLWRWVRYLGKTRPDMGAGCTERVNLEYLRWVWQYPTVTGPRVMREVAEYGAGKRVVVLSGTAA